MLEECHQSEHPVSIELLATMLLATKIGINNQNFHDFFQNIVSTTNHNVAQTTINIRRPILGFYVNKSFLLKTYQTPYKFALFL